MENDIALALKEQGNSLYKQKEYKMAIEKYTLSIARNARIASTHTNRASAYFQILDFENALLDSQSAIAIDRKWTKAYFRAAMSLKELGGEANLLRAIALLRACLSENGVAEERANVLQVKELLSELEELQSLEPKDFYEMKARASECFREGDFDGAVKLYGDALVDIEKSSSSSSSSSSSGSYDSNSYADVRATVLLNRAECYRQSGRMEMCERDCEEALRLQPKNVKGILRRALCREYFEKFSEALEDFENVRSLAPGSAIASEGLKRCRKAVLHHQASAV